jgi:hypothetical protein
MMIIFSVIFNDDEIKDFHIEIYQELLKENNIEYQLKYIHVGNNQVILSPFEDYKTSHINCKKVILDTMTINYY